MKLSRLLLLLAPAFLLGMVPACKKDSGKLKIAVITNNPETFWSYCEAGARMAAEKNDVELIFRKPAKGDPTEQMNIVRDLENKGIAGMAVSVIDPVNQAPDLKLLAGKMKLITMDNDAEGSDRICYIGTDNYAAGHALGKLVREALPAGGTLAVFVGQTSPLNARQRFWGVIDELNGVPERKDFPDPKFEGQIGGKYKLYKNAPITDAASREQAQVNATEALAKIGGDTNVCLIGLWAYNTPKILEAVSADARYKHVKIVGFDEDDETLKGIENGQISASVIQDPYQFGYLSVEILAAEARNDATKRLAKPIPYRLVTKDGGPDTKDGEVVIKNLKASEYREYLRKLMEKVK